MDASWSCFHSGELQCQLARRTCQVQRGVIRLRGSGVEATGPCTGIDHAIVRQLRRVLGPRCVPQSAPTRASGPRPTRTRLLFPRSSASPFPRSNGRALGQRPRSRRRVERGVSDSIGATRVRGRGISRAVAPRRAPTERAAGRLTATITSSKGHYGGMYNNARCETQLCVSSTQLCFTRHSCARSASPVPDD